MKRNNKSGINGGKMVVLMIVCSVIEAVSGVSYTVGDTSGWSLGADYATWSSDKTFSLGDTLVFNYPPGHTVDEVSANDYKTCTTGNAIASDSSGATSVVLKTAGPHYFICGIPGHCGGGMKLAVTVAAAGGSPTVPPTTTPTSPATPTGVANPAAGTMTEPYSSSGRLSPPVAAVLAFWINHLVFKYLV